MEVDLELVKKYDVPGPRYTSYPPATHFTDSVDREALLRAIDDNSAGEKDLSLYFHLPFCWTLCWFCGCTTVITRDGEASNLYLRYLEKEMDLVTERLNPSRKVRQIHLGGGTPTFLSPSQLDRLGRLIHSRFLVAEDVEASVEVDPRRLTRDHLAALREHGFSRASMGVQDNNPKVQEAVHRIQPLEMTGQAIDWLRECGYISLNIDLIYGLPHQTVDTFSQTLEEILELGPDRLAVFSYAHVPWMKPAQKIVEKRILPTPETKLELLKLCIERLTSAGYVYIGMDHFARADDELAVAQRAGTLQRNFQGYSTWGGVDIYAFGMSSISQADGAYWQNRKSLERYYSCLDQGELPLARGYLLTPEDEIRRQTIMRLMCDLGLDYTEMSRLLDLDFRKHFAAEIASLDDLEEDGLVERQEDRMSVTGAGRLLIRNIAMRFDAYLTTRRDQRFSRTI